MNDGKIKDGKTININLDFFSPTGKGGTRKKKARTDAGGIKIKTPSAKKREDTLKKRSILKMIRGHQEERYKQMFEKNHGQLNTPIQSTVTADNFNKDFTEATLFLKNLTEKTEQSQKIKNATLKQYPNNNTTSLLYHPTLTPLPAINADENVSLDFPRETFASLPTSNIKLRPPISNPLILPTPKYGVLKNGSLPTYRSYMNETKKAYPSISTSPFSNLPMVGGAIQSLPPTIANPLMLSSDQMEAKIDNSIKRVSELSQMTKSLQQHRNIPPPMRHRQKKTRRRTHKVGKSNMLNRVSVLISNKTLRNNISTKTQLLKQTPIKDVKKYLINHGFIKVGSIAPNDVLRKMYESAILICGEIHNHAPENLLYNFMNYNEEI